jgi:hypothetical protein
MVEAARDLAAGDRQHARRIVKNALDVTDSPAALVHFCKLAISGGDGRLAESVVGRLSAVKSVYFPAQTLAVRVALLRADLEQAQQEADALGPETGEARLVSAIVAYEQLDGATFRRALLRLREDDGTDHRALERVENAWTGKGYPTAKVLAELARPEVPWGELVAVDLALDAGRLELAERLVDGWQAETLEPAHRLRMARLFRYQGQVSQALLATEAALAQGLPTTPMLIERAYALLQAGQADKVVNLLEQHAERLAPILPWLEALALESPGSAKPIRARLQKTPLPNAQAPLMVRLLAARAMAAASDARARSFAQSLIRDAPSHPELALAGSSR